jgi:hypothetical protein
MSPKLTMDCKIPDRISQAIKEPKNRHGSPRISFGMLPI